VINNQKIKTLSSIAIIYLTASIIIGAFGAHIIKGAISSEYFAIFKTANSYQFYASFSLFVFVGMFAICENSKITRAFYLFLLGSVLFSFSLYALSLSSIKILGAITPIGGTLMIASLIYLLYLINKHK